MTQRIEFPDDVPFTLLCADCDLDGPGGYDEALTEGWQRIAYAPDLPSCNFVGLCAECVRRRSEEKEAERQGLNPYDC